MADQTTRCRACPTGRKGRGKYLCLDCWNGLTDLSRRLLSKRDSRAMSRLRELHRQIDAGVPLDSVYISVRP